MFFQHYLQDDVVEADEVLRPRRALAVLVGALLLQQGLLQGLGHALVALDGRGQLDVGQITAKREEKSHQHCQSYSDITLCSELVDVRVWIKCLQSCPNQILICTVILWDPRGPEQKPHKTNQTKIKS